VRQTLSAYAATLSGSIARNASAAATAQTRAEALATESSARRSQVEGVNLDQELVSLTTYQQAYNASARLIQAAKDMFDILLQMT
jgi:flagellar hook-associated protein 1 FlgK